MSDHYSFPELNILAARIAYWRLGKGFDTPEDISDPAEVLHKLMLVVTEVAEAAEAVTHSDIENFTEEMADAVIRMLDLTGTMGIDIAGAIAAKMAVNEVRPYKHGKVA